MQIITEEDIINNSCSIESHSPLNGHHDQQNIIKYYESTFWDTKYYRSILRKLTIILAKENEIQYIVDGQLLRIQLEKKYDKELEVFTNLEQIKNLEWFGQYGQRHQKVGKWIATWIGKTLNNVGGWQRQKKSQQIINLYSNDGKKQGLWNVLIKNYKSQNIIVIISQAQVYQFGEYVNGLRQNNWVYIQEEKKIGGGKYNLQGQKNGKWIDLIDGFQNNTQVIYFGEYKNGKKVGLWEILYKKQDYKPQKIIGGGSFDNEDNGIKIGQWIELDDKYFNEKQVTHKGEYQYGKKVGRWDIQFYIFEIELICGGKYDQLRNEIKIGNWIDQDEGFYNGKQVTHKGEYLHGKKIGRWDVWYRDFWSGKNQQIGGGLYDERGHETKIGKWVYLDDKFQYDDQIICNGEYKSGVKVGRWDIQCFNKQMQDILQIVTNVLVVVDHMMKVDLELKLGSGLTWMKDFRMGIKQLIKGSIKRVKKLVDGIFGLRIARLTRINKLRLISGGGSYDQRGHGIKIGKWIDLDDRFQFIKQVIYKGEYHHGQKVGRWDICLIKKGIIFGLNYQNIGGGLYDERRNGFKIGNWIDLDDQFYRSSQTSREITYNGDYQNGKKVGRWDIWFKVFGAGQKKKIGGGSYDESGIGIKQGNWMEISIGMDNSSLVMYDGVYKNDKKVGIWMIMDLENNKKMCEINYEIEIIYPKTL